ncbi:hypothetical protein V1525DRAFT_339265 [Lipomyces kononenkoae]|uniref:Uncharacterized protein n=1 Tax=Lipomyces kononenkoae TaxID=34357 RepID=A0ACC3T6D5_LIPKO
MVTLDFSPTKDIPDLSGKVIFITGGTSGLGAASVLELAKHNPARIYFSGRNATNAQAIINKVHEEGSPTKVSFVNCDLGSLSSVKEAAESFIANESRLDILMCNAGIMATPPGLTSDGYEIQFGTNHLGHALLIKKLLPLLLHTAEMPSGDARIIVLSSLGFFLHPKSGIVFDSLKTIQDFGFFWGWRRYGQSKLANILYARELASRYPSLTSVSIHPGVVATGLIDNLSFANRLLVRVTNIGKILEPSQGIFNQLWAASADKKQLVNGQFYEPVGLLSTSLDKAAKDSELAANLWEWTEKELHKYE